MLLWAQDFLKAGLLFFAFLCVHISRSAEIIYSTMEEGQNLPEEMFVVAGKNFQNGILPSLAIWGTKHLIWFINKFK